MITVLVRYKLPQGVTRAQAHKSSEEAAPRFRQLEGLKTKYFLYQEEEGYGGGFYIWESRDAAEAFFTEAWKDSMESRMGGRPEVTYFETAVVVDNAAGDVLVDAA